MIEDEIKLLENVSEPVTPSLGRAHASPIRNRIPSSVFVEGVGEKDLLRAPVNKPLVIVKDSPTEMAALSRIEMLTVPCSSNFSSIPSTDHRKSSAAAWTIALDLDLHPFLIRQGWDKECRVWIAENCDPENRSAAEALLRSIKSFSFTKPEISLSPQGGIALSWFTKQAAITMIVENDVCLFMETRDNYTIQASFDTPDDPAVADIAGPRIAMVGN